MVGKKLHHLAFQNHSEIDFERVVVITYRQTNKYD